MLGIVTMHKMLAQKVAQIKTDLRNSRYLCRFYLMLRGYQRTPAHPTVVPPKCNSPGSVAQTTDVEGIRANEWHGGHGGGWRVQLPKIASEREPIRRTQPAFYSPKNAGRIPAVPHPEALSHKLRLLVRGEVSPVPRDHPSLSHSPPAGPPVR